MIHKYVQTAFLFVLAAALGGCATYKSDMTLSRQILCKPGERALWMWYTEELLEENATHEFVSFCKENDVSLVFMHLRKSPEEVRKVIASCGRNNIRVHALKGSPRMALRKNHNEVLDFVERIANYNAASPSEAKIRGIHLDVEPYLLKDFEPETAGRIFKEYVDLIYKCRRHIAKTDSTLLLGADIPFWLDHSDKEGNPKYDLKHRRKKKPVSEHVIDITDYICVMAYRTALKGRDGVIALASNEIEYSTQRNKKVFVGLETGSGKGIPEKTTFASKSRKELDAAIVEIEKTYSDKTAFTGMAIHHYDSWRKLK